MKLSILAVSAATLFPILALGSIINAPTGSFVDVSNACAHAVSGDTVTIPVGTNIWTTNINMGAISLIGAGTNVCQIVDETPVMGNGIPLIVVNTVSNNLSRISGIRFNVGITNSYPNLCFQPQCTNQGNAAARGNIQVNNGGGALFRCDSCVFYQLTGKPLDFTSGGNNLVDHCAFEMFANAQFIEVDDSGFGDTSWATPDTLGSSNGVTVVENCYFKSDFNFAAIDLSNGARATVRYCEFDGCFFNTHGSETAQRYRSSRQFEIYGNSFHYQTNAPFNNFYTACDIRGGSGVMYSNVFNGYTQIMEFNYYRATDNDLGYLPWYGATGTSIYDSIASGPVYFVASATSNILVTTSSIFGTNAFVGWTAYNTNKVNGNTNCGMVIAQDTHTFTFLSSRSPQYQIYFTNGDNIRLTLVYPMLDMPGRGQGTLMSNSVPTNAPGEVLDTIYVWGNTQYLNFNVPTPVVPANAVSLYPCIVAGRDFSNGVAKPLYTPLAYPYPGITSTNVPFVPGVAYMGSVGKYGRASNMH